MKVKVKVRDFNGKEVELSKPAAEKDHLRAQQIYKHIIFRDRTKYTRKIKHKKRSDE